MYKKIISNMIKNSKKTIPYRKYLKTEHRRNKTKRTKTITEWYRYLHRTQKK